jgi:choice-of-anchor B domain-containing protein
MRTLTTTRRVGTFGLLAGLLLALTVGTTGAIAHPGVHLQDGKYGQNPTAGPGVRVDGPAELVGFLAGVQWGDTGPIEDQSAQLVYGGTGCTPASYAEVAGDIAGNIALIETGSSQTNPLDQCPAATFFQRVQSAEQLGAIGVVAIPAEGAEPNGNATAVAADIPALEVHRTDDVLAVRDAVLAGTAVEVTLVDPTVELEALSDVPCVDGQAGPFACDGIDLLAFVPQEEFDGAGVSDLWGWTDEASGDEYVIVGKTNGVAFFRITEPTAPEYLGELPNPAILEEIWHDIKVHEDHAFIVSESEPHGMTVFDLTRLREVAEPQTWDRDAFYPLTSAAHNIEINTDTGFAYIVGGNAGLVVPDVCRSGLHMVDISSPTSPTFAGCYAEEGGPGTLARTVGDPATESSPAAYVHDTQCVVYDGPDERYTGRELCFNSAEDKIVIADVTDKANPVTVGWTDYPHVAYAHQGWLTEDHAYLIVNDELDELTYPEEVPATRSVVLDVTDLEDPTFHFGHQHETRSITHNNYVVDGLVYQSNYTSGLRVLDSSDVAAGSLEEIAFFDTFPAHGEPTFDGTWSNYPFFASGTIAVSGIGEGLFLLRLAAEDGPEEPVVRAVEVECWSQHCPVEVRAGESGHARVLVHNRGEVDDTYRLEVTDVPDGWTVTIADDEVTVPWGDHVPVHLEVEVPRSAQAGPSTLTVHATSVTDPAVTDRGPVEVEVRKGKPSDAGQPADRGDGSRPGDAGSGSGDAAASGDPSDGGSVGIAATAASHATPPPTSGALVAALVLGAFVLTVLRRSATR